MVSPRGARAAPRLGQGTGGLQAAANDLLNLCDDCTGVSLSDISPGSSLMIGSLFRICDSIF